VRMHLNTLKARQFLVFDNTLFDSMKSALKMQFAGLIALRRVHLKPRNFKDLQKTPAGVR